MAPRVGWKMGQWTGSSLTRLAGLRRELQAGVDLVWVVVGDKFSAR